MRRKRRPPRPYQQPSSEPSAVKIRVSRKMQRLLCYSTVTGGVGDQHYFIYWNAEASTLGVTDLGCQVFEVTLDRRERKKLLRNVAESLVENKWR